MEIIPALIPNNIQELVEGANRIRAFSSRLHLDITDGVFSPAVSWPCGEGQWEELERAEVLPGCDGLSVMVHLMVSDPERIGVLCARAGATSLSAHLETFHDADEFRTITKQWKQAGAQQVGVALLLDTPLSKLTAIAEDIQFVQIMSIARVGFQKQPFDSVALERIREVRTQFPTLPIVVDGGVSTENARALREAGATILIVGSALMSASNPQDAYSALVSAL